MTQINCSFPIYVLPKDANWLVKCFKSVSEQFGFSLLKQEQKFTISTEHPDLFLRPRVAVDVEGPALGRTQPAKFVVTKWTLRVSDNATEIDLMLRELKPSPFDAWFASRSDGTRTAIAWTAAGALLGIFIFGAYALWNYPSPTAFWAWVGRNIRDIVALGLLLLFWLPYFWAAGRLENAPFAKDVLLYFCLVASMIAFVGWGFSVEPLPTSASTEDSIKYLDHLKSNARTLVPILASLSPWLLIIVKWLGLDVIASALAMVKDSQATPSRSG
jgi:hypothetical protein